MYNIRITTIDNLYADYLVEADNIFVAKMKARNAFFRDFPYADNNITYSVEQPSKKIITELINIINKNGGY